MEKMDPQLVNKYVKEKTVYLCLYLFIWFAVSFGIVLFAEPFSQVTFNGLPFHYFMGAQGSIVTFIVLLFVNAKVSDRLDEKYGLVKRVEKVETSGKAVNK
jgi:putative solute:sodium symporter small subunit